MSLRILIRDQPQRAIALATESHILSFHHTQAPERSSAAQGLAPKCMVEFQTLEAVDLSQFRPLRTQGVYGTLGLINIDVDVFLCVITRAIPVACVRPSEEIQRILAVDFLCLNRGDYDHDFSEDFNYSDPFDPSPESHGPGKYNGLEHKDSQVQHPCSALKQVLGAGTFYYSVGFDLTNRLQSRLAEESAFDVDNLEESFLWNSYMIGPLVQFRSRLGLDDREALDSSHILTSAIRGFVGSITIPAASSPIRIADTRLPSTLTLISRLSCRRAGTRFNSRGLDDDGNVANFVESETVYHLPNGLCFSYAQVRGSVPIFWEQAPGLLPQQQKIQVIRSPEATQPAFDRHFEDLELKYGPIHILNLLSASKPGEADLTSRYKYHIRNCSLNEHARDGKTSDHAMLQESQFDFHAETKGPGGYEAASTVRHMIMHQARGFAFFVGAEIDNGPKVLDSGKTGVVLQQEGVFRTNCLDCLDRTNLIQTIISQMALQMFFSQQEGSPLSGFWMRHSTLWADNGDALSKIYAGTGALKSSFTRHGKMSLAGAIADARKSATRLYMNNFADKARQAVIDTLLGRLVDQSPVQLYDPINDYVNSELERRASEYLKTMDIGIWVGTFNLNGRSWGAGEDLTPWLFPRGFTASQRHEIIALGFQEIVELSPNQILSTDPVRRQDWEQAVLKTLNRNLETPGADDYVLLRSGQLVGAALMLFVKSSHLSFIKNVEGSIKKTGMSGMAGNKGAVAIRLDFANTRLCFVTAHLAAGFANYDERNTDYATISHGLRFQRNRSIDDHDTVIWLGDFNYRIGLSNEKVRRYIEAGDLDNLFKNDQLNLQMVAGHTFPFYNEARITFLPTYKYDIGSDQYDTSEKSRIPAWCDRILWKAPNLKQICYDTAPLRLSDHRPVLATFQCHVHCHDEAAKQRISRETYLRRQGVVKSRGVSEDGLGGDRDEIVGVGLSTTSLTVDRRKWWLNSGVSARSTVADEHSGFFPNPSRPANPFSQSHEAEWVAQARALGDLPTTRRVTTDDTDAGGSLPRPDMNRSYNVDKAPLNVQAFAQLPLAAPIYPMDSSFQAEGESKPPRVPGPPVPRKPVALMASPPQPSKISTSVDHGRTGPPGNQFTHRRPNQPSKVATRPSFDPRAGPWEFGHPGPDHHAEERPPPLPSRPRNATVNIVDLDDPDQLLKISTLKPLSPK